MKLNKAAFGLAAGIIWGAMIFLATWWIIIRGGTGENIALLGRFYVGYTPTPVGSVIGLVYGFIDGFITGYIFALIYNAFVRSAEVEKHKPVVHEPSGGTPELGEEIAKVPEEQLEEEQEPATSTEKE